MTENRNQVRIFDTTMRDGEQSPGASMNLEEKLRIAETLEGMGVHIIEAGFPIASNGDFEAVVAVAKQVKALLETVKRAAFEAQRLPFDAMGELHRQDSRRLSRIGVVNALLAGQYRQIGKIHQSGGILPTGTPQHYSVDAQVIAQLIARRPHGCVALRSPGDFAVQLRIDLAPQPGTEQQPAASVLDQHLALPQSRLVVDGYNVTKTVWSSTSLETQRSRLLALLAPLGSLPS